MELENTEKFKYFMYQSVEIIQKPDSTFSLNSKLETLHLLNQLNWISSEPNEHCAFVFCEDKSLHGI